METQAAINHRRAIRDFQSTPVPQADLIDIVRDAQRTPSWGNSQPWKVYIATGDSLAEYKRRFQSLNEANKKPKAFLETMAQGQWHPKEQVNMAKWNVQLAQTLDGMQYIYSNSQYALYNAPAIAILTIPKNSLAWSVYDLGAFAQTLMLAATDRGIATVPSYEFVKYPELAYGVLDVPTKEAVAMGIGLGYVDDTRQINQLHTDREPVSDVLKILD
ncbi:hypothetical protein FC56_GL001182 [Lentilactobacillus senioris DSM 24302 = JCM 17472]|uniref:Nitroreductase domain-containing protein n=1 Tax=Lentilactobacillus senioris DSM 24302 = JCM 17472 TaxID=1423802 RepID=A0A0R2D1Z9_9LACO|nr:nitroreductase [Lentilactobacillus senioris]KRM94230.1 hypothetical protein FC56_GL001182 [Lentilactobacillus senioris DSM 24302 = JCM 17472]